MRTFFSGWRMFGLCLGLSLAFALPVAANAQARRRGNGASQAQNQQMQKQLQQQQAAQAKEQARQQKAFMTRFDLNKNGKIDAGTEKAAAEKYMREVELGKAKPL
jgi:type II secretory pathway pseudopilin PulG